MSADWDAVSKAIFPIKDYEDLCQRLRDSLAYPLVSQKFNFSMPELIQYTRQMLGGDPRGRYVEYTEMLIRIFQGLERVGVTDLLDLKARVITRERLEAFAAQSELRPQDIAAALKYLIYWVVPMNKYLGGLVRDDPAISDAIKLLRGAGIRTNLDLLQRGFDPAGRASLAQECELPLEVIEELVNRADFSRMPWASKATISNIIGAGYPSLARLASADPRKLNEDFYRYGESIGKNLKYGNEIESSYRVVQIVPVLLK